MTGVQTCALPISLLQAPYAGQVVLNGLGASYSINNVAASQDPAAAGNLTLASSPVSFTSPRYLYITSASNDTAFTFTVTGLDVNGQPLTEVITGANAKARASVNRFSSVSNIAVSGNSGSVQVGSFDYVSFTGTTARQVTIISGGSDESGKSFVVTGTNVMGATLTETITGPGRAAAGLVGKRAGRFDEFDHGGHLSHILWTRS